MLQTFKSLDELVRKHRLLLPAPRETWRLVADPLVGQINGLDSFRGAALATNGIMVLLINEVDVCRFGHLGWFVPDADEENAAFSDLYDGAATPRPHVPKVVKHYTGI